MIRAWLDRLARPSNDTTLSWWAAAETAPPQECGRPHSCGGHPQCGSGPHSCLNGCQGVD
ncbi:hypothetical protein [Streptomyces sp. NPDC090022]|uniref:hypothetical protein n=1 Tax=Streptomyces sp. NPDC090022 TaxID=3365920 RepID=UPI003830D160